ncbi:MAG: ComEC/Rec2 family competence protein [bacterium]|nr:ComEC/Rec2 family competence protein [bacterium]
MRLHPYIIIIFFIVIGAARSFLFPTEILKEGDHVSCIGVVEIPPKISKNKQVINLKCKSITITSESKLRELANYPLTVRAPAYPKYFYGDELKVDSTANEYLNFNYPKIKHLGTKSKNFHYYIYALRDDIENRLNQLLPSDNASLVMGMLLGSSKEYDEQITDAFVSTGTLHMIVVSGYNVTLVSTIVLTLSGIIHRRLAIILAIIAIILFVILSGAQPPAIRAGFMGFMVLLGSFFGRKTMAVYLVVLTASVLYAASPSIAMSLSFQLSCLATLGILIIPNILDKYIPILTTLKLPIIKFIATQLKITLSAQIAVTPVILLHFSQLSLIAPLSNLAVSWAVPYIMVSGLVLILSSYLNILLSQIISVVPQLFTAYFLQAVVLLGSIPMSSIDNIKINIFFATSYYAFLLYIITKNSYDKNYSNSDDLKK